MFKFRYRKINPILYNRYRFFSSKSDQFSIDVNKDYYGTLGVSRGASLVQIRQGFISMAKKFHPDLNEEKESNVLKF